MTAPPIKRCRYSLLPGKVLGSGPYYFVTEKNWESGSQLDITATKTSTTNHRVSDADLATSLQEFMDLTVHLKEDAAFCFGSMESEKLDLILFCENSAF
jgi:hypothetical protein